MNSARLDEEAVTGEERCVVDRIQNLPRRRREQERRKMHGWRLGLEERGGQWRGDAAVRAKGGGQD